MTGEQREAIVGYVEKVGREWRSGQATEHTYRPMLKGLVEALLPRVTAINEPKHIECGAPDYLLRRGTDILGFIEAKDVGDGDLDGRGVHKEQFDRYKDSLDTLCFTDYLDFRFYDHHDFVDSVRIAEPKGDRLSLAEDATLDRFVQLFARFAEARPQRICSSARLAQLMAGKARLLAQGVRQYLKREENADSMLAQEEALASLKATGTERSLRSRTHGENSVPFVDNKIALFLSAVNGVGCEGETPLIKKFEPKEREKEQ